MPNLYSGLETFLANVPNRNKEQVDEFELKDLSLTLIETASRMVDRQCRRFFFPSLETRHFDGKRTDCIWISDLIELTTLSYSEDDGSTYTALTSSDFYATVSGDYNSPKSSNKIVLSKNGSLSVFPDDQRAVRIVGVWGYSDDVNRMFEDSQDSVQDNPLSDSATALTVSDVDGLNRAGAELRFEVGQLLRIESEYLEVRDVDKGENKLTVLRGVNGSTAASHVQNTQIDIVRPPSPITDAVNRQALDLLMANLDDMARKSGTDKPKDAKARGRVDVIVKNLISPYIRTPI